MSDPSRPSLLLIDALGLAYRGHFAFAKNPLRAADGRPTSAVYSFLNTLLPLLETEQPAYVAAVFDPPGPTFRDHLMEEYKATRSPMPDDLYVQLDTIKEVLDALGIASLEVTGFEADDVIASMASRAAESGVDTTILTGDKDLLQLVNDHVDVLVPPRMGGPLARLDRAGVVEKMGVPPESVIDLLALMGDTIDNVPGVPGIGQKTAAKLLADYGSLANLYAHIEQVTPERIQRLLVEHRTAAELSQTLVTLARDAPCGADLEALRVRERDTTRLLELCRVLNFRTLAARMIGADRTVVIPEMQPAPPPAPVLHADLTSREEVQAFVRDASSWIGVGLVGEVQGGRALAPRAVALWTPKLGAAAVRLADRAPEEQVTAVLDALRDVGTDAARAIAWNTRTLAHVAGEAHDDVAARVGDLRLLLAAEGWREKAAEEPLAATRGREDAAFLTAPSADAAPSLLTTAPDDATNVEAARVEAALVARLFQDAEARLRSDGERTALYAEVEHPLAGALVRIERRGVRLDVEVCSAMSTTFAVDAERVAETIYSLAGEHFNILSVPELRTILYDKLQLRTGRRTKTGYSTDSDALEELSAEHPIATSILEYRQITKIRSTYLEALPRLVDARTGRIHTTYHPIGAATGRLSSENPNLQNIPIRWAPAREIRRAFIPGESGWSMVGADYSQVELRLLAHLSGEPALVEAFRAGEDVHRRTAAQVAHVELQDVTPELRGIAKTVNFAVIYGQSPFGLARQLGLPQEDARRFIDEFFRQRPVLAEFLQRVVRDARVSGYTSTIRGRRRYFTGLSAPSPVARAASERAAINAPIQGSAADLIKLATVRVDARLRAERLRAGLVLQVHDELVAEAPPDEVERVRAILREEMEGAMQLDVPLLVDLGVGASWYEVHR